MRSLSFSNTLGARPVAIDRLAINQCIESSPIAFIFLVQQPQQQPPQQSYTPEPTRTAITNDPNRNIFVTGVVGRAMGSGNFQIQDIDALTSVAMATYQKYFI